MQILIDSGKKIQTFDGFGASGAWWAQEVGGWEHTDCESGKAVRERISELLFSKESGIGLDIYRYNLGGGSKQSGKGDFSNALRRAESFDCDGGYDFSRDKNAVYMMKQAVADGAGEVIFFVNSPPEKFTKNGMAHTDKNKPFTENLSRKNYRAFAQYCLDVTEHFIIEGVPVKYLSPVNEPLWKWTGGQEGCHYRPGSVEKLFRIFACELKKRDSLRGLKLSGAENGDIRWFNKSYTRCLLRNKDVLRRLDSVDIHSYCMPAPLPFLNNRTAYIRRFRRWMDKHYPGVPVKMSEWTHMQGGRDNGMDSAMVTAKTIYEDIALLGVTSWQHWIAVSEVDYCDGLIYIDLDSKTFEVTKRLYVTGNFSKFLMPGATRIACESEDKSLCTLAFVNPGGDTVVIVINPCLGEASVSLNIPEGRQFRHYLTDEAHNLEQVYEQGSSNISIPAKSVSTFVY